MIITVGKPVRVKLQLDGVQNLAGGFIGAPLQELSVPAQERENVLHLFWGFLVLLGTADSVYYYTYNSVF